MKKYLSLCFELPALVEIPSPVDNKLPEWLLLIPAGDITGRDGRNFHNINPSAITDSFDLDVPLDIEHATEIKAPQGEIAPAQGWFTAIEIRDGAIWGRIEFNADGEKLVFNKHYRYISPAFYHDVDGHILGLSSVGLTNKPNLALPALNQKQEDHSMKISQALAMSLALNPETATEAEVLAAIEVLKSYKQVALNRAQDPDLTKFIPKETYQLALNRAEEAEGKIKLSQEAEESELVDKAIQEGKIAPANKDSFLSMCRADRPGFDAFIATAPKIVTQKSEHNKNPDEKPTLSEHELAMCRKLNITQDAFLAAKPTPKSL